MHPESHRTPRHSFVALVDLTDMHSEKRLATLTNDLNPFGCSVKSVTPFPEGTNVRLRISHAGENFIAMGKVAYSRRDLGMGIAFTTVEPKSLPVLDVWLAGLRKL